MNFGENLTYLVTVKLIRKYLECGKKYSKYGIGSDTTILQAY